MIGEQQGNENKKERPPPSLDSEDEPTSGSDSVFGLSSSESDAASTDDEWAEINNKHKAAPRSKHLRRIDLVKPVREVESGDIDLLEHLIFQVRAPLCALQLEMRQAVRVITSTVAFCYDVRELPDQYTRPAGIMVEEIDTRIGLFTQALGQFDQESGNALAQAATTVYKKDAQVSIKSWSLFAANSESRSSLRRGWKSISKRKWVHHGNQANRIGYRAILCREWKHT